MLIVARRMLSGRFSGVSCSCTDNESYSLVLFSYYDAGVMRRYEIW